MGAVKLSRRTLRAGIAALSLSLSVWACSGPQPVIERSSLIFIGEGEHALFRAEIVVANRGNGNGQIAIEAIVRSRTRAEVLARASRHTELHGGEVQTVIVDMPRPQSSADHARSDMALEVEAHYPVE